MGWNDPISSLDIMGWNDPISSLSFNYYKLEKWVNLIYLEQLSYRKFSHETHRLAA